MTKEDILGYLIAAHTEFIRLDEYKIFLTKKHASRDDAAYELIMGYNLFLQEKLEATLEKD